MSQPLFRIVDDDHVPGETPDAYLLRMLHQERQRIIDALGLTKDDPGYWDGFAENLVDIIKDRLARAEEERKP